MQPFTLIAGHLDLGIRLGTSGILSSMRARPHAPASLLSPPAPGRSATFQRLTLFKSILGNFLQIATFNHEFDIYSQKPHFAGKQSRHLRCNCFARLDGRDQESRGMVLFFLS